MEKSIEGGLRFLARSQGPDGSYGKWSRQPARRKICPTAMSSLVGLTFLSSGRTPTRGPYARNLQKSTEYLLEKCADTRFHRVPGLLSDPLASEDRTMYCHGFAMTYLALVFPQEADRERRETIRDVLKRAHRA